MLPVVRALAAKGAVVSIDTRHVEVAKAAVRVGASIVNDVTGFTDPKMVEFVAKNTCGVIIVHAGEVSDQPARARTAVQLDTSAAAFVAERAREAEEEAAAAKSGKAKRVRGKRRQAGGHVRAAAASLRRGVRRGGEGSRAICRGCPGGSR